MRLRSAAALLLRATMQQWQAIWPCKAVVSHLHVELKVAVRLQLAGSKLTQQRRRIAQSIL